MYDEERAVGTLVTGVRWKRLGGPLRLSFRSGFTFRFTRTRRLAVGSIGHEVLDTFTVKPE